MLSPFFWHLYFSLLSLLHVKAMQQLYLRCRSVKETQLVNFKYWRGHYLPYWRFCCAQAEVCLCSYPRIVFPCSAFGVSYMGMHFKCLIFNQHIFRNVYPRISDLEANDDSLVWYCTRCTLWHCISFHTSASAYQDNLYHTLLAHDFQDHPECIITI